MCVRESVPGMIKQVGGESRSVFKLLTGEANRSRWLGTGGLRFTLHLHLNVNSKYNTKWDQRTEREKDKERTQRSQFRGRVLCKTAHSY